MAPPLEITRLCDLKADASGKINIIAVMQSCSPPTQTNGMLSVKDRSYCDIIC